MIRRDPERAKPPGRVIERVKSSLLRRESHEVRSRIAAIPVDLNPSSIEALHATSNPSSYETCGP
jgi:hypothetical protein